MRAIYRDPRALPRIEGLQVERHRADLTQRSSLREAIAGCDVVFHTAAFVASSPVETVWRENAALPVAVVKAAAAAGARQVVLTSSAAAFGPARGEQLADERNAFPAGGLGLTYVDAKRAGQLRALETAADLGIDLVVVNPTYMLGSPATLSASPRSSARIVGSYIAGALPAVVEGSATFVDVADAAKGHVLAAERGENGECYILGGASAAWAELIEKVASLSGVRQPVAVLPRRAAAAARALERRGIRGPIAAEGLDLMGRNWRYTSEKAQRELGFNPRPLEATLNGTIDWYRALLAYGEWRPSQRALVAAAAGLRLARAMGLLSALRPLERRAGRRLFVGYRRA